MKSVSRDNPNYLRIKINKILNKTLLFGDNVTAGRYLTQQQRKQFSYMSRLNHILFLTSVKFNAI